VCGACEASLMCTFRLVAVLSLDLMIGSAHAQKFLAAGAGVGSCGTWTTDRRYPNSASALIDASWVLGFLSGIGYAGIGVNPLNKMDYQGIAAWIDDYCHDHPIDPIARAAAAFAEMHPR
jgi:hypothetical protein